MKVWPALPETGVKPQERPLVEELADALREGAAEGFRLAASPEEADLVVLIESNRLRTHRDLPAMRAEPLPRRFPHKCFTINHEFAPPGFLPGLYTSLPARRFDPSRHRTWCYFYQYNRPVLETALAGADAPRKLLFSFRGAASHEVRRRILAEPFRAREPVSIRHVDRWFDHDAEEQDAYVREILESHFVLCPRGIAAGSHRLFEVMSLGRCPVILSDDWVPPAGIDWSRCSIRVSEADVPRLPEILEARVDEARGLGEAARRVWLEHFQPHRRVRRALEEIRAIQADWGPDHDERAHQRHWSSWAFYWRNGWTLPQRSRKALRRLRRAAASRLRA